MLKFDPSKVFYEYVYIKSLNKHNIIVAHDDNGEVYRPDSQHKVRANKDTAVKIHKKVFDLYEKNNKMSTFYNPRRACIFYYEGHPLMIDVFMPGRHFDNNGLSLKESDWVSANITAFDRLKEVIFSELSEIEGRSIDVYIDGESLFFNDPENVNPKYKKDGSGFFIQNVRYIRLEKMSIQISRKIMDIFSDRQDSMQSKMNSSLSKVNTKDRDDDVNSVIVLKNGSVIGYNPNYNPDIEAKDQDTSIMVYSPILATDAIAKFDSVEYIPEKNEYNYFFNLNFLIKAGRTIGKHYSFAETDFLNIPKVIEDTGIFNLATDISYKSKSQYPVSLHYHDVLAYMFRFLHRETDLNVYRDLVALFKMGMMSGSFDGKEANQVSLKEGVSMQDIKRKSIDVANIGKANFSHELLYSDVTTCPVAGSVKKKQENLRRIIENNRRFSM